MSYKDEAMSKGKKMIIRSFRVFSNALKVRVFHLKIAFFHHGVLKVNFSKLSRFLLSYK